MARPKAGVNAYQDIIPIWNAAATRGEAQITLREERHAIVLVQRLNQYRVLDRKQFGQSYYDRFTVARRGNVVVITQRNTVESILEITDLNGRPIDMGAVQKQMDVAREIEVEQTAREYGIKLDDNPGGFDPDKPLGLHD